VCRRHQILDSSSTNGPIWYGRRGCGDGRGTFLTPSAPAAADASEHPSPQSLHHGFALATHNAVLIGVSHLEYCAEHEHVVEAIGDRDPDGARRAMHTHLRHVRRRPLGDND
jgi:hypothetical protein